MAEWAMLGVTRIKSPVTIRTPGLNKAFSREEMEQVGINPATLSPARFVPLASGRGSPRFDDCSDLKHKDTLVVVCLSGGGARAARMAAHSLAFLEAEFNRLQPAAATRQPFFKRIDAWSSVSGGSIYASFVAAHLLSASGGHSNSFAELASEWPARWGGQKLGGASLVYYLWPGNLGYPPTLQVGTEWATLHLFARNLALLHEPGKMWMPLSQPRQLGDLPVQPRFYFNATCRETARPLIFTQSVLHRNLLGDPLSRLAVDPLQRWISNESMTESELTEPFRHAVTLEDLGSPPHKFPLAFAAMASAAFPGVFEPLQLRHYLFTTNSPTIQPVGGPLWWRQSEVTVVDGGIYDNSGLITALQLLAYLRHGQIRSNQSMIVLALDANNEAEGYTKPAELPRTPWKLDLPFRGATSAAVTIAGIYESQQSLVMAAIQHQIRTLERDGTLKYFPIRLRDAELIAPPEHETSVLARLKKLKRTADDEAKSGLKAVNLLGIIQDIPTDFVLTDDEDRHLKITVEGLLLRASEAGPSVAEGFLRAVSKASIIQDP